MTTDSERLAVIESTVMRIETRLFGSDIDEGEIGHLKSRVTSLEHKSWYQTGFAAALVLALKIVWDWFTKK